MHARPLIDDKLVLSVGADVLAASVYYPLMGLAGVLAAVSFFADSVPILIGAMVVAPAFPPLALTAFALVGGYPKMAGRALLVSLAGFGVAVGFAVLTSWIFNASGLASESMNLVSQPLLEERVRPGWYSVVAAGAAGIAGALAVIKRKMDALIGTVASVALVPAASAGGIALYAGHDSRALGGLVLFIVNLGLIVACGILTLLIVRPGSGEADERARQPDG